MLALDFGRDDPAVQPRFGARRTDRGLECVTPLQHAEAPFARKLDGFGAVTVGGWFFPRRAGEQYFFCRGLPEIGPGGERFFRPNERWVNFVLGTDQHGFFLGTVNGNGAMPFPHFTLHEVPINAWNQLVVVKDRRGYQHFYANGALVHTDRESSSSGKVRPFCDRDDGGPVRAAVPLGGLVGEAWVHARALSPDEIRKDFEAKHARYRPALPVEPVELRTMDAHPSPGLWEGRGRPLVAAGDGPLSPSPRHLTVGRRRYPRR